VATIRATTADLLLVLWGRLPADDQAVTWDVDSAKGRAALGGSLVP
jgi:hypothetical protein